MVIFLFYFFSKNDRMADSLMVANRIASIGVFCVFFTNPCKTQIDPAATPLRPQKSHGTQRDPA
jgi:hypothetical protein